MAIRITRVYTKTGDRGETALVGGWREPKDAPRIEAYGTIDEFNAVPGLARVFNAERLRSFVLPGGGRVARTVCRRAEREILRLVRIEPGGAWPLTYVNRLSDLLFVLSRWAAKRLGEPEYLWERGLAAHDRPRSRP